MSAFLIVTHPISQKWLDAFAQRKDLRRVQAALNKLNKSKSKIKEEQVWEALAACEIIAALQGAADPLLPTKLVEWALDKGPSSEEHLYLALEVLERLPIQHKFEAESVEQLANLYARIRPTVATIAPVIKLAKPIESSTEVVVITGYQLPADSLPDPAKTPTKLSLVTKKAPPSIAPTRPPKFLSLKASTPVEELAQQVLRYQQPLAITIDLAQDFSKEQFSEIAALVDYSQTTLKFKDTNGVRSTQWYCEHIGLFARCHHLNLELGRSPLHWLENFSELKSLSIKALEASVEFLANLMELTELKLTGSIKDVHYIAQSPQLLKLSLDDCEINQALLESCPEKLRSLELKRVKLEKPINLSRLTELEQLTISEINTLEAVTFLFDLPQLKLFSANSLPNLIDLTPLISLDQLNLLALRDLTAMEDLATVSNLHNLNTLIATGLTRVAALPSFTRLITLKRLHLEMLTSVIDYRSIMEAPMLEELVLGFTHPALKLSDFSFLKNHPTLQRFDLRNTFDEALAYETNQLLNLPTPDESRWPENSTVI